MNGNEKHFVSQEVFEKLIENLKKKCSNLSDLEITNNALEALEKKGYLVESPLPKDEEIRQEQVLAGERVVRERLRKSGLIV